MALFTVITYRILWDYSQSNGFQMPLVLESTYGCNDINIWFKITLTINFYLFSDVEYKDVATKYKTHCPRPIITQFLALTVVGTQSRTDTRCFKKY